MPVETASAAAGITATVGGAATMWAALTFEPTAAKSDAAAVIISGSATTYAISTTPLFERVTVNGSGVVMGCTSIPLPHLERIVSCGAVNNHPGFQDNSHLTGAGGLIYLPVSARSGSYR